MPTSWRVHEHDSLPSTQDLVKDAGRKGEPQGYIAQAHQQTAGYGRHGRHWVSDHGNLYMSVLLRPSCKIQDAPQISLIAALALSETLTDYLHAPDTLILKWPNDVLILGKKCAGILIETELSASGDLEWMALGMGINLKHAPPDIGIAVSDVSGQEVQVDDFRDALLANFEALYADWQAQGFQSIKESWLSKTYPQDAIVQVKVGSKAEKGAFIGLDDQGNMLIRDEAMSIKTISAGEVHFPEGEQNATTGGAHASRA